MPHVDREGTPEHTTHFESCGCAEAEVERLRADSDRAVRLAATLHLRVGENLARIAELEDELDSKQQSIDALFAQSQSRSIRIAELLRLLKRCEKGGYKMHGPSGTPMLACPICRRPNEPGYGGHAFDCDLAAALKGGDDERKD